jgi:hypothetical protein
MEDRHHWYGVYPDHEECLQIIFPRPFQEASHGSIVKRFLVEHDSELPELLSCIKPTSLVT